MRLLQFRGIWEFHRQKSQKFVLNRQFWTTAPSAQSQKHLFLVYFPEFKGQALTSYLISLDDFSSMVTQRRMSHPLELFVSLMIPATQHMESTGQQLPCRCFKMTIYFRVGFALFFFRVLKNLFIQEAFKATSLKNFILFCVKFD